MIPRPILLALRDAERAVSDAARGVGGTFARLRLATDRAERMAARLPADDRAEVERAIENLETHYRQAIENRSGGRRNRTGTLEELAGHLGAFKGYTAAERREQAKESARVTKRRAEWLAANGFRSEADYDRWLWGETNRTGRKPKTIGSGVWIHAHNGDPTKLDEEIGGGLLREIAGPHRLDVQAKTGRRDAATTAKAWMESHPPLSENAYLEIQDDKAGELVARYAGVPRKRGAGFQWEAQARPRRAPPVRKGPPAGYVPWRKEPQYLFADPTYRQAAELTARQYGIAPSAFEAPAPAPLPPPPRRAYTFTERGQGQLFNAAGGRARRRRKSRRNACGCGG